MAKGDFKFNLMDQGELENYGRTEESMVVDAVGIGHGHVHGCVFRAIGLGSR
jgi:hypothetical protein